MTIDFDALPKETDSDTYAVVGSDFDFEPSGDQFEPSNDDPLPISDRFDSEHDGFSLLPMKFECGDSRQSVNRVFGGDFTAIWEFPWWLAHFQVLTLNTEKCLCFTLCLLDWILVLIMLYQLYFFHRMALLIYNTNTSESLHKERQWQMADVMCWFNIT